MSVVLEVLDRSRLASVCGGWSVNEWVQDLKQMTVINAGQYAAGAVCFAATSIPLHGKFFIPPSRSWRTVVPFVASVACSAGTGATIKQLMK